MKTLIFVLLVLPVIAQEIPRKANLAIITHEQDEDLDLFLACCLILEDKGYRFEKMDADSLLLTTHPRHFNNKHNFQTYHKFDLSVSDNKVEIKTFVVSNDFNPRAGFYKSDSKLKEKYPQEYHKLQLEGFKEVVR